MRSYSRVRTTTLIQLPIHMSIAVDGIVTLLWWWYTLLSLTVFRTHFNAKASMSHFKDPHQQALIYSLAVPYILWTKPHYRAKSVQRDCSLNLSNVTLPGTGIPLYIFLGTWRTLYLISVLLIAPLVALVSSVFSNRSFTACLTMPQDWFSLWRVNCSLSTIDSWVSQSKQYHLENKWDFLSAGVEAGIATTPYWKAPDCLVLKNKNEEGGMGVHLFHNASSGGDWIIQDRLQNAKELRSLLPDSAALSTFRVVTLVADHGGTVPVTCVFRAALANSNTDHSSVLFSIDMETSTVRNGFSNTEWYETGLEGILRLISRPHSLLSIPIITNHPDSGKRITDTHIPVLPEVIRVSCEAHRALATDVPIIGWDVAWTDKGVFILEANLSCNLFMGDYDQTYYYTQVTQRFVKLFPLLCQLGEQA